MEKKNYAAVGCLGALLYFPFGVIMALTKKYK